jgi:hypothetical protein
MQEEFDAAIVVRPASGSTTVCAFAATAAPASDDEDGLNAQGVKE